MLPQDGKVYELLFVGKSDRLPLHAACILNTRLVTSDIQLSCKDSACLAGWASIHWREGRDVRFPQ